MLVATADPLDVWALDDLRGQLGADVQPILHPSTKIIDLINQVYGKKHDTGGNLGQGEDDEVGGEGEELVDILDVTDEAPIIRWVNSLLFNAVKERASDIHIEPGEKEVMVRYRIDGVLYETRRANRQFMPSIVSRVKIMAGLNIAEKRLPQDGRIRRKIAGKEIDMRVATVPTVKGAAAERITIRLLDRESVLHDLADIGFGDDHLRQMDDLIHRPHGILLVTGPTGSGKTTTLYACLAKINAPDLNILTIEDPVEYQLDGISQTAVNEKDRADVRGGVAVVPAARSGRHHGRRDPRSGNRRDCHSGVPDRTSGAVDDSHQRRAGGDHPARGLGRTAVLGGVVADGALGSTAGPPCLPGLPRALQSHRRGRCQHRDCARRIPRGTRPARAVQGRRGDRATCPGSCSVPAKAGAPRAWATATRGEPRSTSC